MRGNLRNWFELVKTEYFLNTAIIYGFSTSLTEYLVQKQLGKLRLNGL